MEPIQLIGIDGLSETQKAATTTLVNRYFQKIALEIKKINSMVVHVKVHTKGGSAKKYDIRVRILAPTKIFEAQESDWDLRRTLHKVLKNIEREILHRVKSDNQKK